MATNSLGKLPIRLSILIQSPTKSAVDGDGNLIFLQAFLDKEANEKWIVPGAELQIKRMVSDGDDVEAGFSPLGVQRLLDWIEEHKEDKWIGITQINPTAYNGFDNKIIFMDATDKPNLIITHILHVGTVERI